ncbi:hypothetical protein FIBSPDRAFT_969833 [Athelia psychrophila]|uniref:C2H2-type domain-containing protein n=1 Tax=Athelia psychrophila TaxID=1759441 RepID=A0A167T559_9AGAM|nr:hypothetical protein FIBSPDRAFT_969833 [Fibularhizoctonia sp. CBS 109695]
MSVQGRQSPTHDMTSSPTPGFAFDGREMTLPPHSSQRISFHRSSLSGGGLLLPPSPTALRRSHSRGSISSTSYWTTPDCTDDSSASSLNERGLATPAMLAAAEKRRKNPAKYQCLHCHALFTTESSCKRHLGEKRLPCSKPGCGQLFSNDDDRKRHEMKSKKHATM